MKTGKYSVKRVKGFVVRGAVIFGFSVAAAAAVGLVENRYLQCFILLVVVAAGGLYFADLYWRVYVPNRNLQRLIEDYKKSKNLGVNLPASANGDLIREIQHIIASLDTITIKQKNAEILMKNAEINNLQDQINPHFLYNTLEVIRGEALLNGDKKIAEMTASLANYFRYNISRKESFVYLKDELKNSMNYFNIQKNRFGDKISCEIIYQNIEAKSVENCYIPKLILQPIIENAIYHGLELKMGPGTVKMHITTADSDLKINIADDGLGMPPETLDVVNSNDDLEEELSERHNGVATRNIKNRLKLYWGERAYMIVTSEPGMGTQVHLSMPLLYQKEEYMNQ